MKKYRSEGELWQLSLPVYCRKSLTLVEDKAEKNVLSWKDLPITRMEVFVDAEKLKTGEKDPNVDSEGTDKSKEKNFFALEKAFASEWKTKVEEAENRGLTAFQGLYIVQATKGEEGASDPKRRCGICGKLFKEAKYVEKHMASKHGPIVDRAQLKTCRPVLTEIFKQDDERATKVASPVETELAARNAETLKRIGVSNLTGISNLNMMGMPGKGKGGFFMGGMGGKGMSFGKGGRGGRGGGMGMGLGMGMGMYGRGMGQMPMMPQPVMQGNIGVSPSLRGRRSVKSYADVDEPSNNAVVNMNKIDFGLDDLPDFGGK